MDRVGASYDYCIEFNPQRLGANPMAMQIPIGSEARFIGVVDLLTMQAVYWEDEMGRDPIVRAIPPKMLRAEEPMRARSWSSALPSWMMT